MRDQGLRRALTGTADHRTGFPTIVSTVTDQLTAGDEEVTDAPADVTVDADAAAPSTGGSARRRRVSKWDRPPDPHDWRFFVGNLGKVLIATGMLLFGFVAYQLWGTGIETARAQSSLKDEFAALVAANQADGDAEPSADDPVGDDTADPTVDDVVDEDPAGDDDAAAGAVPEPETGAPDPPAAGSAGDDLTDSGGESTGSVEVEPAVEADSPVPGANPDELPEPVIQDIPAIERGNPLALLEIPAIGRSDIVLPGVAVDDLKKGPGHYPDTPLPGQLGNASIAGHRTTYGSPFFDVDQLEAGDELIVTMANGDQFTYEVTFTEIVAATDYWVVTTRDSSIAELTLTSCHPKYTARDRIVVHSVLNPAKSANVGVPTFYDLGEDTEEFPGDDPTLAEPAGEPATAGADADEDPAGQPAADPGAAPTGADEPTGEVGPADGEAPAADDGDALPGTGSAGSGDGGDDRAAPGDGFSFQPVGEAEDAFARGWFHDSEAFPQIALWGAALTVVALAAYALSRRFRHDSIGLLAGILPFVVGLYFFFQNVNRLLPPGL